VKNFRTLVSRASAKWLEHPEW